MRFERALLLLVAASALAVLPRTAVSKPEPTAASVAEGELLKACRSRLAALNHFDVATLDRLTHRDYIGTGNDGVRLSKAQLLKTYAPHSSEPPNTYGPMEEVQVHLYGNTGILNYRIQIRERFGDRDVVTSLRRTDVFLKEEGRWQAVAAQLTDIPISHHTPVAGDATLFDQYVGDYELFPGNVDHVTHEGQALMSESSKGKAQFLALGEEKFFFREDTGQVTFMRDASGRVSGYSYQRCDGQQLTARKIR